MLSGAVSGDVADCLDGEVSFWYYVPSLFVIAPADVAFVGFVLFEFASVYIYREAVRYNLEEASFVFGSWSGGFEEFADSLSAARVSNEEVRGLRGGDCFYWGVFFGGWWAGFV